MQTTQASIERSHSPSSAVEPELAAIPAEHIGEVFPLVRVLIEGVAERSDGRYSVPGMLELFARGTWLLWVVWDGGVRAIVGTEIYHDVSGMRCCMIRFATGREAKGWTHLLAEIEDYARAQGCERLDMLARKGWAKHLPDYKITHVAMEKDLT